MNVHCAYSHELSLAEDRWPELVSAAAVSSGVDIGLLACKTMVAVGSGCSLAVARLAESVFAARGAGLTRTCTPFELIESSFRPDLVCLVTASGAHPDIIRCFLSLKQRSVRTLVLTLNRESELAHLVTLYASSSQVIVPTVAASKGGFIPVQSTLALTAMLAPLLDAAARSVIEPSELFALARNDHELAMANVIVPPDRCFVLVCTNWARAAGLDFETRITEAGLPSPALSDPWNFGHGRYMPVARHQCSVVTMGVAGESAALNLVHSQVPEEAMLCRIGAPVAGLWGGIYCMIRSMLLVEFICAQRGIDPASASVPRWGDELYLGGREI